MLQIKKLSAHKRIALIAHNHKKEELIQWVLLSKTTFLQHQLFATGKLVETALSYPVKKLLSGPMGGDQQIGSMIATGDIDMVIFFWDPMEAQPHDTEVKALLRLCAVWNIPMACDRATADFVVTSPFMHQA